MFTFEHLREIVILCRIRRETYAGNHFNMFEYNNYWFDNL